MRSTARHPRRGGAGRRPVRTARRGGRRAGGRGSPPSLGDEEYGAIGPSVRLFEPREALVSGPDGLDATRALLAGAQRVLEPGGLLALELDERRAEAVRALALASGWTRVVVHEDLFGRPRYALARAGETA